MKPILSLALLAGVALAAAPSAQAQAWNRRISDIHIVHPPGTPPGTWRVETDIECQAIDDVPLPADFSYDVHVLLNGIEIEVVHEPMTLEAAAALCNFATCNGGYCGLWVHIPPYLPRPGTCRLVMLGSGALACGCTGFRHTIGNTYGDAALLGTALLRTDQITVTVEPSFGSVQDDDPSDDSMTILAGPEISFCDDWDGALASCPCANPGNPDTGCDIAQATGGVGLTVVQQETVPQNRVTMTGSGFPTASTPTAVVIRADALEASPVVFGDGLRCIGIPLVRLGATFASGGSSTHAFGHSSMAGSGDFHYQIWFRNTPAMYCTPDAFNLSNGRTLTW